jgi:DNA-binding NarL/FixJ family response regulator
MATRTLAVVAERQNFYNAGIAAVLQREVGFAKVVRVHDYAAMKDILSFNPAIDFIALDFDLPGSSGLATISEVRASQPLVRMAVFSERAELRDVLAILAAGAHGFIPRQTTSCAELLRALKIVNEDGIFVPPSLVETRGWRGDGDDAEACDNDALAGLTERQQQVIKLLSEGHANKVIARELGISPSTVKVHVHAAFRALGVHSRLAALAALRPARHASREVA